MMKSFFKKLAFVMALAMVVSMVAPAGAVFAAEVGISYQGTKTIVTAETIEIDETVDFSYQGYEGKDWKTTTVWESSDPSVAAVDTAGKVTGLKDGVTTITVTVGADKAYKQSVVVTVGTGKAADVSTPVVNSDFTATQKADDTVELVFADKTITKEALSAGLSTYFVIYNTEVNYPVFYVDSVKDGVAVVKSYVLFEDGTTYGFTYGGKTAEITASIGEVAYVTAMYKSENTDYAAYVGKDTQVVATLWNSKGIDITKSAQGAIQYSPLDPNMTDFWPSGTEGSFVFNAAGLSATIEVTYMTGEFDEFYNQIAGPKTRVTILSSNIPEYTIDQTVAKVATIAEGAPDWTKANTVIALGDDKGAHKIFVKMKDNRGNEITTEEGSSQEGTFTFQSTNDAILYVAADGTVMTNREGEASVLVYLTPTADENAKAKVVAVVPVTVAAKRKAVTINTSSNGALVVSTESDYNEAAFKFTLKDQLNAPIDGDVKVTCNNEKSLPTGVTVAPEAVVVEGEYGEYTVKVFGDAKYIPTTKNANGYTYTFTIKVDNWLTRTFNVTMRKPIKSTSGVVSYTGYKLEFEATNDIKTMATTTSPTAMAFNNTVTLYQLSNNVKYNTATIAPKPENINQMKVGNFYYAVTKDGSALSADKTDSYVKTVVDENGVTRIEISLTQFKDFELNGKTVKLVEKDKKGTGLYTVVVYKGVGSGTTGVATATNFSQLTSASLNVTDTQDKMGYLGRNGQNEIIDGASDEDIVKNNFIFQIGDTTLDHPDDYTENKIEVVVDSNRVTGGTVVYINSVKFYKNVGVDVNGTPVYVEYKVNVGDYVTYKVAQ